MKQRRLKITGIFIPFDRPLVEEEITACSIENPFQHAPFRLTVERIGFFMTKGKTFYYLDSLGKEVPVRVYQAKHKKRFCIQANTEAATSLLSLPLIAGSPPSSSRT